MPLGFLSKNNRLAKIRAAVSRSWLFLIAVIVLALVATLVNFVSVLQPVDRSATDAETEFVIEKGDGLREIVDHLTQAGLIRSPDGFKFYSLLNGTAHLFKPGYYKLSPSWNAAQIAKVFVIGPPDVIVVITEGETFKDVDYKLAQAGAIESDQLINYDWQHLKKEYPFLKDVMFLEGFLFPDTYRFSQFSPVGVVVRKFLDNFLKHAWPQIAKETGGHYESLIIASMIEKEAPFKDDRAVIAGIIYKRLQLGMPLQIDAASAYSKCGKRFFTCDFRTRLLSKKDLVADDPYSTYSNKGLPPTPIANPGLSAIESALNPRKTSYLYYISDPETKRTVFAKTLDEHNTNRVKYLMNR